MWLHRAHVEQHRIVCDPPDDRRARSAQRVIPPSRVAVEPEGHRREARAWKCSSSNGRIGVDNGACHAHLTEFVGERARALLEVSAISRDHRERGNLL